MILRPDPGDSVKKLLAILWVEQTVSDSYIKLAKHSAI